MKKKPHGFEREGPGTEPPLFICQDRQCSGPMMTRVYLAESSHPLEDPVEPMDLRENIPVKKRTVLDHPDRL
jgi:hypothetical protein